MTLKEIASIAIDKGAPNPMIICKNNELFLSFYNSEERTEIHERNENIDENISLIKFSHVIKHSFGSPDNDMLYFHNYSKLGIEYGCAYNVIDSDWIKEEIDFDRQHPYFNIKKYEKYKHFVFVFKDNLFECIAQNFELNVFSKNTQTQVIFNLFLHDI
jgi:hypothetical protein